MKLTAPPPGSEPEPELPPQTPAADAGSPEVPAPAVPYQAPPPRVATWPTWFGPADGVLAALALVVVFLGSSFAARNSDIWLHLAAGKRLTTGEYKLGSDPFSYTAADRPWINHSWLFDLAAYSLHSGNGSLLVILKALAATAAFALLLLIRRSGQPLWPWAVLATLAALASLNMFTLRPYVASVFFLALTLYLVFRMPSPPGSWRLPLAIAGTFALWSNFDGWFILGPLALALLAIGEAVRTVVLKGGPAEGDPLGSLPDLPTLVKAIGLGGLACMVNPHHVAVWEIPFELVGVGTSADPRVRAFFHGPLKSFPNFWSSASSPSLGENVGGIAYLVLVALGLYASFLSAVAGRVFGSAAEVEPLPVPHMLLWVGFAALAAMSMFAIPFFAIVTVPLVASRFNLFTSRIRLGTWDDRASRMLLLGSSGGRMLSLLGLLLLGVAAYPGWLHPSASCWWETNMAHPANLRRVEWVIDPDPDMKASAEWLAGARERGGLSPEARGFVASMDLANYCAWFAPQEKVFANGRLGFHQPELAEFSKARRGLGAFTEKSEMPDPRDTEDVLKKWKLCYVAIALQRSDSELTRILMDDLKNAMWLVVDRWTPWHFTGRSVISGWREGGTVGDPSFHKFELSAEHVAYGPDVPRTPPGKAEPPIVQQSTLDELFNARKPTPTGVEEAMTWLRFKARAQLRNQVATQAAALLRLNQPGIAAPNVMQAKFLALDEILARNSQLRTPPPADGSFRTYPILALRATRRAIAENPDHPDGYFALAQVLSDNDLPIGEAERIVSLVSAYQMCLARMPKPADFKRNFYIASPSQVAESLAMLYFTRRFETGDFLGLRVDMGLIGELAGGGFPFRIPAGPKTGGKVLYTRVPPPAAQGLPEGSNQITAGLYILPLDLAQQSIAMAEEYAKVEAFDAESRAAEAKRLGDTRKMLDAAHRRALEQYRTAAERAPKLRDRHQIAMNYGLVGEALKLLLEADLPKEYGVEATRIYFHLIALQLAVGRLEEAAGNLAQLREEVQALAGRTDVNPNALKLYQQWLNALEYQKLLLEGNYGEAGKLMEGLEGAQVGLNSLMDVIAKDGIDPTKYKDFNTIATKIGPYGVIWPMFSMFAIPPFGPGEPLAAAAGYVTGRAYWEHFQSFANARNAILQKMQADAEFFYRRGTLSVFEGDIPSARARFESAKQPAPKGWGVPEVRHTGAENFLRMFDAAAKYQKP